MTEDEFNETWESVMRKLTAGERELVETVIEGARVNNSIVFYVIALLVGLLGGWTAAGGWS
jgi:hypothetical protein